MSQAYRKSISMIIIQLNNKTLRATLKVLENARGARTYSFAAFVISQFTC